MENEKIYRLENYSEAYELASRDGLVINELEPDENGRRFVVAKPSEPSETEKLMIELYNLKNWFNHFYTKEEQKLRRLNTLNLKCDDGQTPYNVLITLYQKAENNRKRIQEIEVLINGN